MTLYDYLSAIESAKRERTLAEQRERALAKPPLKDRSRVPELYECFKKQFPSKPKNQEVAMVRRRMFVLIIARLYCPHSLAGGKLGEVRGDIARIFHCSPSAISHSFRHLCFHFKNVKTFRQETEDVFRAIIEEKNINLHP